MVRIGCSCNRARRHRGISILPLYTGFGMTRSQSDREDQRRGTLRLLASLFFVASAVLLVRWLESGSTGARIAMVICLIATIVCWVGVPHESPDAIPDPPSGQPPRITPSTPVLVLAVFLWLAIVVPATYLWVRHLPGPSVYIAGIGVTSLAGFLVGGLLLWQRPR